MNRDRILTNAVGSVLIAWSIGCAIPKRVVDRTGTKPARFVRLSQVDPRIRQDLKLASTDNLLGRAHVGYHPEKAQCWVLRSVAERLKEAEDHFLKLGYSLVVLDCYRPHSAEVERRAWLETPDTSTRSRYYPALQKSDLKVQASLESGFPVSQGSVVDVMLERSGEAAVERGRTLDFGTPYDAVGPWTHIYYSEASDEARHLRFLLRAVLEKYEFQNHSERWWQFVLMSEPMGEVDYDFVVD